MGKILSINPMSFTSGPGIRVEVILSNTDEGMELTPNELVDRIRKFRPYFGPNGGGVTFKGENIFLQSDYISEVCHICHKAGINTCIMTTGNKYNNDENILKYLDLVIIKIESIPLYNYNNITEEEFIKIDSFINKINEKNIPLWINQEIKKNINDNIKYIKLLKKFIRMYQNVQQVDIIGNIDNESLDELKKVINEV